MAYYREASGMIRKFLKVVDGLSEWVGKLGSWLILALTGIMVYEVLMRYLFAKPTFFAYDLTWMLYGAYISMGAAYCHLHKGHVRVDFFYTRLPLRGRTILEVILYVIFFFPLFYVVLRYLMDNLIYSWASRECTSASTWRPPIYPFKTVIVMGFVLLFFQGVSEFVKNLYFFIKGHSHER